jgi:cell division septation protein DedD
MGLGDEAEEARAERRTLVWGGTKLVFAGLLMLALFVGAIWYAYDRGISTGGALSPPLIRADTAPTKARPEEPGGLDVPHRDKLVYETLSGDGEDEPVERLLPPPEEPVAKPEPPEEVVAVAPALPSVPVTPVTAEPVPPPPPLPESAPAAVVEPPPEPQPAPPAAPPPVTPEIKTAALGVFRIQLASYREAAAATQGWHRLSKAHSELLGDLSPAVIRVDLGADKGIYYRLLAGPLTDKATADTLCQRLKAKKVGCLVVKP